MTRSTDSEGWTNSVVRWELGSDFDLTLDTGSAPYPWTEHPHSLWGSGRDAIRGLLEWGVRSKGWRRLLMPSYFCQDVVEAALLRVDVRVYPWSPLDAQHAPVTAVGGDVVLVPAMFGEPPVLEIHGSATIIEDHSHDLLAPWAMSSRADYAIASLRKTLPLPDGGVAWSPRDLDIPSSPGMTPHHAATVGQRLSAMILKHHYLAGDAIAKHVFRDAAKTSEQMIASGPTTGISPFSRARIPTLPVERWRSRRALNLATFRGEVGVAPGVRILEAPYAAILVFDEQRVLSSVREALIANDIYPSVLWPLEQPAIDGIPEAHVGISRRMLTIQIDHRYGPDDMRRAAGVLKLALGDAQHHPG